MPFVRFRWSGLSAQLSISATSISTSQTNLISDGSTRVGEDIEDVMGGGYGLKSYLALSLGPIAGSNSSDNVRLASQARVSPPD